MTIKKSGLIAFFLVLSGVFAFGQTEQIQSNLAIVNQNLGPIDRAGRDQIIRTLNTIKARLQSLRSSLANRPFPQAKVGWHQVYAENCNDYCGLVGQRSGTSVEGASCASGENVIASALSSGIQFVYGCWPNCSAEVAAATTNGSDCYKPGQKKDGDATDLTVGCFCN